MSSRRFWGFTVLGLAVAFGLGGWLLNKTYMDRSVAELGDRLELYSLLRKAALEQYFSSAEAELRFWSLNPELRDQLAFLNGGWQRVLDRGEDPELKLQQLYVTDNPYPAGEKRKLVMAGDGSPYSEIHATLHPMAELFVVERHYYDFFLIGLNGDIYYTVEKESDFATNLLEESWRETGLADVYQRAMEAARAGEDKVAISDMTRYAPSGGAAALFMASAMTDAQGDLIGAIAFQLPTDQIEEIMAYGENLSNTGELYAVGEDRMMRSNSRFFEEPTILTTRVDSPTVERAFAGEVGNGVTEDYRGVEVLSAYSLAEIDQTRWAIMAEMDVSEAREIAASRQPLLAGAMLFLYGLGLWTAWFSRGEDDNTLEGLAMSDLEFDHDMTNG